MKRDERLQGLSSDHHQALVLARNTNEELTSGKASAATVARVRATFEAFAPHFATEEEELLPALRRAGESALVERTLSDHAAFRAHLAAAEAGDLSRLQAFADLLVAHVRFEENELYPAFERLALDAVMERIAERAAPPR